MSLVLCTSLNAEAGPHIELLKKSGFDCRIVDRSLNLFDEASLIRAARGAVGIVAGSEPYTPGVLRALTELRCIARTGVGFDAIDVPTCDELGIVVSTTPGVNHHSVAEHAIALLMGVSRGFPDNDRQVREGRWKRVAHPRVMGRTIGLIGLGRIGQATATRCLGLGLKVIAHEPYPDMQFVQQYGIPLVDLDTLYSESDYVSLHCPMSKSNYHLINRESLAKMKPGAVLINTARGPLVDEAALCEAIQSGHIRGAGLDVFEVEPLPLTSPLLNCPNILFAGHLAGLDNESHEDSFAMAAQTIIDLRAGQWPTFCIQNLRGKTDWDWKTACRQG